MSKARKVGAGGARGPLRRRWPQGQCLEMGGSPYLARGTSKVGLCGCILGVLASRNYVALGVEGALGHRWSPEPPSFTFPPFPSSSLLPSWLSPGPLRSMVEDLQSEESDEDDSSSGEEAAGKTNAGRDSRCPASGEERAWGHWDGEERAHSGALPGH